MTRLKSAPPPIGSPDELLAMAHALEKEAARCYRELAARMRLRREAALVELFQFLAGIEEKHAGHITARAAASLGRPIDPARIRWEVPENFDEEEGNSRLLTPYRALAVAVRNEERAFAFYCHIAAEAPEGPARALAEELAKDELAHAFLLRRERRKAYRKENIAARRSAAALPGSVEELWHLGAECEWRAARYHRALVQSLYSQGEDPKAFVDAADDEENCARQLAAGSGHKLSEEALDVPPTVDGGLRLLEEAFDRYADIAERSPDERIMHEAQLLAARAVRRLSLAHGSAGNALLGRPAS